MQAIVDGPLPTDDPALAAVLAQAELSAELLDFVRRCLQKEAAARPTALQLQVGRLAAPRRAVLSRQRLRCAAMLRQRWTLRAVVARVCTAHGAAGRPLRGSAD